MALRDWPRTQKAAATAIVWVIATATAGWILGNYVSAILGTTTGIGIFLLMFSAARDHSFETRREFLDWLVDLRRPTRRGVAAVILVLAVGLASRLVLGTAHSLLIPTADRGVHRSVSASDPSLAYLGLLFAVAVVGAPIFEELVFRNGLQKLLAVRTGAPAAIVVTSLLFALFHVPSYGGFEATLTALALPVAVVFVDSVLYGMAYWRTGNIVVAMAAHGASNAVAVVSYAL